MFLRKRLLMLTEVMEVTSELVRRWIVLNKTKDIQYATVTSKHAEFGRVAVVEDRPNVLVIEYPHRKSGDNGTGGSKWMIKREVIPRKDVTELRYYVD